MKRMANKNDTYSQHHKSEIKVPITDFVTAAQRKLANYLQLQTERFSSKEKKISLLLFSVLLAGLSITVMLYSFLTVNTAIVNRSITFPKYALKHEKKLKMEDSLITNHEYLRINQFKHYLEHLKENTAGSKIYDSILLARPHLLDSIHLADSLFLTQ